MLARLFALLLALPLQALAADPAAPSRVEAEFLDGTRYSLANSRGAVTLVVAWSPESLASRKCIGELQRFASLHARRGVRIVPASTLKDRERLRAFAAERELDLALATLENHDLGPLPEQALPVVFVFDRDGNFRATRRGLFRLGDLERLVEPLL